MSIQTPEKQAAGGFSGEYGQERNGELTQGVNAFLNAPMSEFELDKTGFEDSLDRVLTLARLADFSDETDRLLVNKMTKSLAESVKAATPAWDSISQNLTEGHAMFGQQAGNFESQRHRYDKVQGIIVGMVERTLEATDPEEVKRLANVTDYLASNLGWSIQVENEPVNPSSESSAEPEFSQPSRLAAAKHFHVPHWAKKDDLSKVTLARRGVAGIVVAGAVAAGPVVMASSASAAEMPQGTIQTAYSTSQVFNSANNQAGVTSASPESTTNEQPSLVAALANGAKADQAASSIPAEAPATPAAPETPTATTESSASADVSQANSLASALSSGAAESSPTASSADSSPSTAEPTSPAATSTPTPLPGSDPSSGLVEALSSGAQTPQGQETDAVTAASTATTESSSPSGQSETGPSTPDTPPAQPAAPAPTQPAHNQPKPHHHSEKLSQQEISQQALNKMKKMGPSWHNRAVVMEVLMNNNWQPDHAAGAIGNICVEAAGCDLNPRINQIGYSGPDEGMGIVQWTKNGRWQTLLKMAHEWGLSPTDIKAQAKFIDWEVRHTERVALGPISASHGTDQATLAFSKYYERPKDVYASLHLRQKYARDTMNMYEKLVREVKHDHAQANHHAHHNQPEQRRAPSHHFDGPVSSKGYTTPISPELYAQEIGRGTGYNGYHHIAGVHTGVDIPVSFVPFRAVKGGVVTRTDEIGLGIYAVEVKQDDGLYAVYQHVDPHKIAVHPGEHVSIGQHLGTTGNSGYPVASTGPHLHVSIQTQEGIASKSDPNVFQETNNPMDYLPSKQHVEQWLHHSSKDNNSAHDNGHSQDHGQPHDNQPQPQPTTQPEPSPAPSPDSQQPEAQPSPSPVGLVQQLSAGAETSSNSDAGQSSASSSTAAAPAPVSSAPAPSSPGPDTTSSPAPAPSTSDGSESIADQAPGNSAQGHANGNDSSHGNSDSHSTMLEVLDAIAGL